MRVISFSDARNNLKGVLDKVSNDCSITIIHRRDAKDDAVVMSLENYNSMADTIHLMSSQKNREHLAKSIAQYKAGKAKKRDLVEVDETEEAETA